MLHNILLTGVSGYLGGDLLAHLGANNHHLPAYNKLFAAVRTEPQAQAVRDGRFGAEPLVLDMKDTDCLRRAIVDKDISIIFYLIDPVHSNTQIHMIEALAAVKQGTGRDVHFLHTSGAKLFSSHAGAPTDRPLIDTDPDLYEIQIRQNPELEWGKEAVRTNSTIIEHCEANGVRGYIFALCIVYGESRSFGNKISIQTVAIVKAAKAAGHMYRVDEGRPTWPVAHVRDTTSLYFALLRAMLSSSSQIPPCNKSGYYLASPGAVALYDIYASLAAGLFRRGLLRDPDVHDLGEPADEEEALAAMARALDAPDARYVHFHLGGRCSLTAENGRRSLGWVPEYGAEHILDEADEEVGRILGVIGGGGGGEG